MKNRDTLAKFFDTGIFQKQQKDRSFFSRRQIAFSNLLAMPFFGSPKLSRGQVSGARNT